MDTGKVFKISSILIYIYIKCTYHQTQKGLLEHLIVFLFLSFFSQILMNKIIFH